MTRTDADRRARELLFHNGKEPCICAVCEDAASDALQAADREGYERGRKEAVEECLKIIDDYPFSETADLIDAQVRNAFGIEERNV